MVKAEQVLEVRPPDVRVVEVPIRGKTELIMHRWSDKAKKMMLDKQMGKKVKKEPKDPEQDYQDSIYYDDDGKYAMPSGAFKTAIVDACRNFDNITMTQAKRIVWIEGEWVPIEGEPRMREDPVRIGPGTADIRYRAGFKEWSAVLPVRFVSSQITLESVINLVEWAGLEGVGEWRPSAPKSKSGTFGVFSVDIDKLNNGGNSDAG